MTQSRRCGSLPPRGPGTLRLPSSARRLRRGSGTEPSGWDPALGEGTPPADPLVLRRRPPQRARATGSGHTRAGACSAEEGGVGTATATHTETRVTPREPPRPREHVAGPGRGGRGSRDPGVCVPIVVHSSPNQAIRETEQHTQRNTSSRPLSVYTLSPRSSAPSGGGVGGERARMQTSSSSSIDDDLQIKPFGARS